MTDVIEWLLIMIIFVGFPNAVLIHLIFAIVRYVRADRSDSAEFAKHKKQLIGAGVLFGLLAAAVIGLIVIMSLAIAHM